MGLVDKCYAISSVEWKTHCVISPASFCGNSWGQTFLLHNAEFICLLFLWLALLYITTELHSFYGVWIIFMLHLVFGDVIHKVSLLHRTVWKGSQLPLQQIFLEFIFLFSPIFTEIIFRNALICVCLDF